jgi:peptidoglycan hydrolase-like protein with peptidoglycan-binding domain
VLWTLPEYGTPPLRPVVALVVFALIAALLTTDGGAVGRATGLERCPSLAKGDVGLCVARAQQVLNQRCAAHLAIDGIFGDLTVGAVKSCQAASGLQPDGQIGPLTKNSLVDR